MKNILLINLFICLCTSLSYAQVPLGSNSSQDTSKTIAIYPFEGHQLSTEQVNLYTSQLRSQLVQGNHFQIVERNRIEAIMQEQGFSASGSTQEAIEMGKLLKVDYILTGSFALSSGRYYATAELIHTQTGQIERSIRVEGKSGEPHFIAHKLPLLARKIENPQLVLKYPPLKSAAWIGSGLSALSLGLGLYFEAQAQSQLQDFKQDPTSSGRDEIRDSQNYRDYAYYTAGTLAISSLVLWFWPQDPEDQYQVQPQVRAPLNSGWSAQVYGLQLTRRF